MPRKERRAKATKIKEFPEIEETPNEEATSEETLEREESAEITSETGKETGGDSDVEPVDDGTGDDGTGDDQDSSETDDSDSPDDAGPDGEDTPGESSSEEEVGVSKDDEVSDEDADSDEPGEFGFQEICHDVHKLLTTPEGRKINCKLRIENPGMSAIIYQGLRSNVWGRIKSNGRHRVYRHALKKLLLENKSTARYFEGII